MRNRYSGYCYGCSRDVGPGDGYFERNKGGWKISCITCTALRKVQKGKNLSESQSNALKTITKEKQ